MRTVLIIAIILGLVGCSSGGSSSGGRYSIKHDHGPSKAVNLDHVQDAVPKYEPKSRGGNKSRYTVLGKTYSVMPSAVGYTQTGVASWYGKKFHGHLTSNGERYDMYSMSAAHKSVPLPTYLRVTNLANNRQVIVRVNDRGPFHGNRLIDLSYAAAYKLDMLRKGTARVRIEAITPGQGGSPAVVNTGRSDAVVPGAAVANVESTGNQISGRTIQAGSFSNFSAADKVRKDVSWILQKPAHVAKVKINGRDFYRVLAGPLSGSVNIQSLLDLLARNGYPNSRVVDFTGSVQ